MLRRVWIARFVHESSRDIEYEQNTHFNTAYSYVPNSKMHFSTSRSLPQNGFACRPLYSAPPWSLVLIVSDVCVTPYSCCNCRKAEYLLSKVFSGSAPPALRRAYDLAAAGDTARNNIPGHSRGMHTHVGHGRCHACNISIKQPVAHFVRPEPNLAGWVRNRGKWLENTKVTKSLVRTP